MNYTSTIITLQSDYQIINMKLTLDYYSQNIKIYIMTNQH